jgi:hypothetical protein
MIAKGTPILRNLHMLVDGVDLYSRNLCIETCLQRAPTVIPVFSDTT